MEITIILSQLGSKANVVEPSLSSFRAFFSEAKFVLYTDGGGGAASGVDVVRVVSPPFSVKTARYGWHAADLYKVIGLLECGAGVGIAIDADMEVVSPDVRSIVPLAAKFGLCVPANPRYLVREDAFKGADGGSELDESRGCGFALNTTPIAFGTGNASARRVLETFRDRMIQSPRRAPLMLWNAAWEVGFSPHILPFQWCVSAEHIGVGNEIILHVGHSAVESHYHGKPVDRAAAAATVRRSRLRARIKRLQLGLRNLLGR